MQPSFSDQHLDDPYGAALEAALKDLAAARSRAKDIEQDLAAVEARIAELQELTRILSVLARTETKERLADEISELQNAPARSVRGGPIYDNVIRLFSKSKIKQWKATEVHAALEREGKSIDVKSIYNILNYLAKKGDLKRVGRGLYLVPSSGFTVQVEGELPGFDEKGGACAED